jgi:hypothetical protein
MFKTEELKNESRLVALIRLSQHVAQPVEPERPFGAALADPLLSH